MCIYARDGMSICHVCVNARDVQKRVLNSPGPVVTGSFEPFNIGVWN